MFSIIIPKTSLTADYYEAILSLVIDYYAVVLTSANDITIELRTIRINGEDIHGCERAIQARDKILSLSNIASYIDSLPEETEN